MGILSTASLKTLNRLINDYESVAQEYKKGYPLGDQIYPLFDQLKIIKECSKKKNPKNTDFLSLTYLSQELRHTLLKETNFKTIKTPRPAYVNAYLKYKGIGQTLCYKASSILVCDNEVITDLEIDCDDMNKYIFESLGEKTDYKLEDLDMGFSTDNLADIDFEYDVTYETYKDGFEKEYAQIQNPLCYARKTEHGIAIYSWKQTCELNAHLTLVEDNKINEFCSAWKTDPNKRTYAKMDMYPPPLKCPDGVYNMWSGFDIKGDATHGECETFLNHVALVKENGGEYLLNWFAHIVQFPGKKTCMCPILRGKQGTGKSIIVDVIIKMLGSELSYSTGKLGEYFEKHSHCRKGKIFNNVDEVDGKTGYTHNETLKNAITSETHTFEAKGINPITVANFNNFFITTNNAKSIPIQGEARRYVVFEMGDEKIGEYQWFENLITWSKNDDNIASLFEFLSNRDITNVNLRDIPMTEALMESKILSLPSIVNWITYKIVEDFPQDWDNKPIDNKDFLEDFKRFSNMPRDNDYNIQKFGCAMKKNFETCLGISKTHGEKGKVWRINRQDVFDWLVKNKYTLETELKPAIKPRCLTDDY
jgi:hypothetical protein